MAKSNVASLNKFVEQFSGHEFWSGVDVHKRSYHIAIYRVDGEVRTFVCPACPVRLFRKFQSLNVTIAGPAYEVGHNGFSLARTIQSADIRVIVAAPSRISRPVLCCTKTDRLDCILVDNSVDFNAPNKPITTELQGQIFDSMVSIRRKKDRRFHLGLGLFVARTIAEFHGGTIRAENRNDEVAGAVFVILLPLTSGR